MLSFDATEIATEAEEISYAQFGKGKGRETQETRADPSPSLGGLLCGAERALSRAARALFLCAAQPARRLCHAALDAVATGQGAAERITTTSRRLLLFAIGVALIR